MLVVKFYDSIPATAGNSGKYLSAPLAGLWDPSVTLGNMQVCKWATAVTIVDTPAHLGEPLPSRMTSSHVSPQVCRPHFHGPLSWLSDPPKPIASSSAWGSPFACPQDPQDKLSQVQTGQSGQHIFSFPPTPPKDSTPDSVQTAPAEYQATINAFMHQAQVGSGNAIGGGLGGGGVSGGSAGQTADSCGLDVKPCLTGGNGSSGGGGGGSGGGGGGQNQPKQREGTTGSGTVGGNGGHTNGGQPTGSGLGGVHGGQSNAGSGSTPHTSGSGGGGGGGGLFDGSGQSAYGGYDTSGYGYHHQHGGASFGQSNPRPAINSPHMKPQRTKARTSAAQLLHFMLHGRCELHI
uniref:Uncharacterized protein n=1 Tax=Anopheles maculatus TaxID=74869 RepID=A0A182STV5_9DIPT